MLQPQEDRIHLLASRKPIGAHWENDSHGPGAYIRPGETLPIRVRVVRTENQLKKAIKVRADAYGRHTPEFAAALRVIEHEDKERSSLVLLSESKITGEAVGTLRIHTNFDGPTYLERVLRLPDFLRGAGIAYVTRLAVASGPNGSSVKLALFKALYRYCLATQISWIMAVAREPVDRDLARLGFQDILPVGEKMRRPADFGDVDVRPLYFNVLEAEYRWRSTKHPLYDFMIRKVHPDIEIFASVSSAWSTPRQHRLRASARGDYRSDPPAQIMAV